MDIARLQREILQVKNICLIEKRKFYVWKMNNTGKTTNHSFEIQCLTFVNSFNAYFIENKKLK